jgi:hypothetical protein
MGGVLLASPLREQSSLLQQRDPNRCETFVGRERLSVQAAFS